MKNKIHYVETALSRQPNKSEMDIIKKLNPFVKFGVFNEDEDNIIRKYWTKFQQVYMFKIIHTFFLACWILVSYHPNT